MPLVLFSLRVWTWCLWAQRTCISWSRYLHSRRGRWSNIIIRSYNSCQSLKILQQCRLLWQLQNAIEWQTRLLKSIMATEPLIHWLSKFSQILRDLVMNCFGSLTLNCLVTTKRSHILKPTCSFPLQVCWSMCGLLVKNRHKMVNSLKHISNETIISKDFENRSSLKNVQENLAQA